MKKEAILKYIDDGYSPIVVDWQDFVEQIKEVKLYEFTEKDLIDILTCSKSIPWDEYDAIPTLPMFKTDHPLKITIEHLEKAILSINDDTFSDPLERWFGFLSTSYKEKRLYTPDVLNYENDDVFFDKEESVIVYIANRLNIFFEECDVNEFKSFLLKFMKETLENSNRKIDDRIYSPEVAKIILGNIYALTYGGKNLPPELEKFYKKYSKILLDSEDYQAMWQAGYDYYEGANGYPVDFNKACYYLTKCYEKRQDPEIARTLGYIYYYGRTTNGVPQGDKAFQYFAIGTIAGSSVEATYKLADCYIKGFGTPINHQAAFNLVRGLYDSQLDDYLYGCCNKFADVSLRLGSYYKDGIDVNPNKEMALKYYLNARCAIKDRLSEMEYIGDRVVATSIFNNIKSLKTELSIKDREICENGYVTTIGYAHLDAYKIQIKVLSNKILEFKVKNPASGSHGFLLNDRHLGFAEKCKFAIYHIYLNDKFNNVEELISNKFYFVKDFDNEIELSYVKKDGFVTIPYEKIVLIPQKLKTLEKKYCLAEISFDNGKTYTYLIDEKTIDKKLASKYKNAKILSKYYCYLDELPFPIEKITKIL